MSFRGLLNFNGSDIIELKRDFYFILSFVGNVVHILLDWNMFARQILRRRIVAKFETTVDLGLFCASTEVYCVYGFVL